MRVFYCDHFVLPLPPDHSFPMAKYRLTRHRIVDDGIVDVEVDDIAQTPAHCSAQFGGQHIGRFDLHELIGVRLQRDAQFETSRARVLQQRREIRRTLAKRTSFAEFHERPRAAASSQAHEGGTVDVHRDAGTLSRVLSFL